MELIGPESDLTKISLMMGLDPDAVNSNFAYSLLLITTVPDWDGADAIEWLSNSGKELSNYADGRIETTLGNTLISFSASATRPFLFLTISTKDSDSGDVGTDLSSESSQATTTIANSTETPTSLPPTPGPSFTQEIMIPMERLGARVLLVGTIGNGGLEPGTHEYRDDNGEKAVQGNNCYLVVNRADPSTAVAD